MNSYYYEGKGLTAFLEKAHTIKEMLANYFRYECEFCFGRNLPWMPYMRLIDNVCDKSEELFGRNPAILFRIELVIPKRELFIKIKNNKQEIITILTIYFSCSATEIEARCKESAAWSNNAFLYILRE